MVILILDFPEESDVFDKPRFNMFIIHELAENIKFFPQKLVSEVHLEEKKQKPKTVCKVASMSSKLFSVFTKLYLKRHLLLCFLPFAILSLSF